MKYNDYRVMRPNGEVEAIKVPTIFDAFDVAKRLIHSIVFLRVPAKATISTRNRGFVEGPAYVLVDRATEDCYAVTGEIKAEHDAYHAWKTIRSEGFEIA